MPIWPQKSHDLYENGLMKYFIGNTSLKHPQNLKLEFMGGKADSGTYNKNAI